MNPRIAATIVAAAATAATAPALAAGTWRTVTVAPQLSGGGMTLLSDGTVLCKTVAGNTYGDVWMKLTPNALGSYAAGTWSTVATMNHTRYYFSSQMLRDGRVYVAGGEYGTGKATAEVYNPLTNTWTLLPNPGANVSDANSEMLPDGRVMQALVAGTLRSNVIFNPVTNTYSAGPSCVGIHNESAWLKLADDSILMVDRNSTASERYHPSTNTWIADATVPVALYDPYGLETGGAVLLPDGRAMFFGSLGPTAFYTRPASGNVGTWTAGPSIPNGHGQPDAPVAMMPNGRILLAASPAPTSANHFPTPTFFYEFNPVTNAYTALPAPDGAASVNEVAFAWTFLCLPNGSILVCQLETNQYYIYEPDGTPLAAGRPQLDTITRVSAGNYRLFGRGFNGISEGACYGDDWQMATNYPVVRLSAANGTVRYARTANWNLTGVQTGAQQTTTDMALPAGIKPGSYSLEVTANGIASLSRAFFVPNPACPNDLDLDGAVNGSDLALLLAAWGGTGTSTGAGDLDGDGTVGGGDLALLLGSWGICP